MHVDDIIQHDPDLDQGSSQLSRGKSDESDLGIDTNTLAINTVAMEESMLDSETEATLATYDKAPLMNSVLEPIKESNFFECSNCATPFTFSTRNWELKHLTKHYFLEFCKYVNNCKKEIIVDMDNESYNAIVVDHNLIYTSNCIHKKRVLTNENKESAFHPLAIRKEYFKEHPTSVWVPGDGVAYLPLSCKQCTKFIGVKIEAADSHNVNLLNQVWLLISEIKSQTSENTERSEDGVILKRQKTEIILLNNNNLPNHQLDFDGSEEL